MLSRIKVSKYNEDELNELPRSKQMMAKVRSSEKVEEIVIHRIVPRSGVLR